MRLAIDETRRRRELQEEYNRVHNITPATIKKSIRMGIEQVGAFLQAEHARWAAITKEIGVLPE